MAIFAGKYLFWSLLLIKRLWNSKEHHFKEHLWTATSDSIKNLWWRILQKHVEAFLKNLHHRYLTGSLINCICWVGAKYKNHKISIKSVRKIFFYEILKCSNKIWRFDSVTTMYILYKSKSKQWTVFYMIGASVIKELNNETIYTN